MSLREALPGVVDEHVSQAVAQQVRLDIRVFSEYNLRNIWLFNQPTQHKMISRITNSTNVKYSASRPGLQPRLPTAECARLPRRRWAGRCQRVTATALLQLHRARLTCPWSTAPTVGTRLVFYPRRTRTAFLFCAAGEAVRLDARQR
jgi:hypothetical protein